MIFTNQTIKMCYFICFEWGSFLFFVKLTETDELISILNPNILISFTFLIGSIYQYISVQFLPVQPFQLL